MESGLTRRAGSYIDQGDYRYFSRVVEAVEIRKSSESGIGAYLPRVRGNCPPLVGEPLSSSYWSGGALWRSNQSAIPANGTGVSTP